MFRYFIGFILVLVALFSACGGCGGDDGDGDRGEFAFSRCDDDSQCGSSGTCLCGICSLTCESDDVCSEFGAICADSDRAQVACEETTSLCLVPCDSPGTCLEARRGLECREGFCSYRPSLVDNSRDMGTISDMPIVENDMGVVEIPCDVPCLNGGICSIDRTVCSCPPGTSGDACEIEQPIRQVVAGANHICVIFSGGKLKCWGENVFGQLGLGDSRSRGEIPGDLAGDEAEPDLGPVRIHSVSAGRTHTCALFANGRTKCWGDNMFGQLGQGDTLARGDADNQMGDNLKFVNMGERRAVKIVSGDYHNCVTFEDETIGCWGLNDYGQLGDGSREDRGELPNQFDESWTPIDLGEPMVVDHIAAGHHHCALRDDQTAVCWGQNSFGQLGTEDAATRGDEPGELGEALDAIDVDGVAMQIATKGASTCVRLESGLLKCFGFNGFGQLGQNHSRPLGDEPGEMGANLRAVILPFPAIDVVAGESHYCAILADDSVRCWGANQFGQLGQGHNRNVGIEQSDMETSIPLPLPIAGGITKLVGGSDFTCIVVEHADLYCWGDNSFGQLGIGSLDAWGDNVGEIESLISVSF